MRNCKTVVGSAVVLMLSAGASMAFAVVEPTLKFWGTFDGGAFDEGPWLRFNGEEFVPATTPGTDDVAVFDVENVLTPVSQGFGETWYTLTFPTPVALHGLWVGDVVTVPDDQPQASIDVGESGLRIGLSADRGGALRFPGTIRSAGPVEVGVVAPSISSRAALMMASTSRLLTSGGVDVRANGWLDGAGVIEGGVRNAGRFSVMEGAALSMLVRGDYTQDRAGAGASPFGGELSVEIAGPSEHNDTLFVEGQANLGGTLLVRLINGYNPQPGQLDAVIVTAQAVSGRFDLVFFSPALSSDLRLKVNYPPATPAWLSNDGRSFQSVRVSVEPLPPQPGIGDGSDGAAPIPGRPARATASDLNGDGFIDVAAVIPLDPGVAAGGPGATPGQLLIIMNLGVNEGGGWRGFADPVVIAPGDGFNPADLAAGDLDKDGDTDLVVVVKGAGGPASPGFLRAFLNDGTGAFTLFPTAYPVGNDPRGVALANLVPDPDALLDAAVTSLDADGQGQVVVLANTPSLRAWGGFGNTFIQPLDDRNPQTVTPGGLDNPKDVDDLAVGSGGSASAGGVAGGGINVLINNNLTATDAGASVFQPAFRVPVGNEPRFVAVRDIDGDGDADIVTSNMGDGTVSLVLNEIGDGDRGGVGAGSFVVQSLPVGPMPGSLGAFDFDGDTDSDIAAVVDDSDKDGPASIIRILRNDTPLPVSRAGAGGSGLVFALGPAIDFDTNPLSLIPGDVDNDGDVDIIAFVEPDGAPSRLAVAFVNAQCPTDLDGSGVTDTADLCRFLWLFGNAVEPGSEGDFILDGVIDTRDLVRLLARFGQVCR